MQIVSSGDNVHEILSPVFWENKKNIMSQGNNLHETSKPVFWAKSEKSYQFVKD